MYLPVLISVFACSMFPGAFAGFREDFLSENNRLRKLHGSPDLELVTGSEAESLYRAVKMMAANGKFDDEMSDEALVCKTLEEPVKCAQQWYDEIKDYDFDKPGFSDKTKGFTTLIWKASTMLNTAAHQNATTKYNFVIAHYTPKGNIEGQFKENVPRKNGSLSSVNLFQINIGIVLLCSWLINKILA